jgi:hypothetical protein
VFHRSWCVTKAVGCSISRSVFDKSGVFHKSCFCELGRHFVFHGSCPPYTNTKLAVFG